MRTLIYFQERKGDNFCMDIKIIYLTNDTRRYAGMKNACLQLQDEMKISDLCMAVKLERSSEWNYVWERKLRGSLGAKAPGQQPGCGQVLQQYF